MVFGSVDIFLKMAVLGPSCRFNADSLVGAMEELARSLVVRTA
jgi:hypothetical protein